MNTFALYDLRKTLIDKNAFIYHGAGMSKGIGSESTNALPYLDRLRHVITRDLEICCSTVQQGDSESNFNFWGKIGLILWPRHPNSITLVSPADAGTIPHPKINGRRQIERLPITLQSIIDSIDMRLPQTANEWCILDYDVIGLFIEPPIQYFENSELHNIEIIDVFQNFPNMRVFAFFNGHLREVFPSGYYGAYVSISDLYVMKIE